MTLTTEQHRVAAAAEMLFTRVGIKSVSMDDIARQMGISKKTLYQEVESKEALIRLVLACDVSKDLKFLRESSDRAHDAIDEFLRNSRYFIREMRQVTPTMLYDLQKYYPELFREQVQAHHQEFKQFVVNNVERGMEEGLYRNDLDAGIVGNFYYGIMVMVIDTSIFPAQDRNLSDIIRQLSQYHFHGIVNAFGRERLEKYLDQEALD